MKEKDEDYRLSVSIFHNGSTIYNVLANIYLPVRLSDPIEIRFLPTKDQYGAVSSMYEFGIKGEIKNIAGIATGKIEANKVQISTSHRKYWGKDDTDNLTIARPVDLRVIRYLNSDSSSDSDKQKVHKEYWLTPSSMLRPQMSIDHSYTGDTKVRRLRPLKFTVGGKHKYVFDSNFHTSINENDDAITWDELVARTEIKSDAGVREEYDNSTFGDIDDFLLLVSFAERRRCICVGWEGIDSTKIVNFYRRNLSFPKKKERDSYPGNLIELRDFNKFIRIAYRKFIKIKHQELLRQALHYMTSDHEKTIETAFVSTYSAIETLSLRFKKMHRLDTVMNDEKWDIFHKELKKFIKEQSVLRGSSLGYKRRSVYKKLPELNRASFSYIFDKMCEKYKVDLSDLWPVVDRSEGVSLTDIRNKLVHGEYIDRIQRRAIIFAHENLRWIAERIILSILGCPVEDTRINKHFLAAHGGSWREERDILSKSLGFRKE